MTTATDTLSSTSSWEQLRAPRALRSKYDITNKVLGSGHTCICRLGYMRRTREPVAIKLVARAAALDPTEAKTEANLLRQAGEHRNIVRLLDEYETAVTFVFVFELLEGGELFDQIVSKTTFPEVEARELVRQVASALAQMHANGVVHRDLKPENMLMSDETKDAIVKITDFGLSKITDGHSVLMKTPCGTPGYIAPEVLHMKGYGKEVDMWSVGVIVYILLCGFPPFYADNDAQLFQQIKAGKYEFLRPYWDPVSPMAKEFVSKLLVVDPKRRLTAEAALDHPWLAGEAEPSSENLTYVTENLKDRQARSKLKGIINVTRAMHRFQGAGSESNSPH